MTKLSLDDLATAWERVKENDGCAGVDGVTIARFAETKDKRLERLKAAAMDGSYRPLPLLRILVEKVPGKTSKLRRLLVPAVVDRVLQTAVARQLSASYEDEFLETSFAYRPGRSVDRAVARVVQLRDRGFLYVLDADIEAFFDSVPHPTMLGLLGDVDADTKALIASWLDAEIWDGMRLKMLGKGLPQGSPISPLLANLFLTGLDAELSRGDNHLVRYADDFLVLCPSEGHAADAMSQTSEWLEEMGLKLHPEKTAMRSFASGFQFLGVHFRGEEVFVPWKNARPKGRVITVANRMPEAMLARYRWRKAEGAMQGALRKAMLAATETERQGTPRKGVAKVAFLYLTEQGSVLRKSGDRFLVEKNAQVLLDLPYHKLEQVLVFGGVQLTTQSMGELMERGIRVSLFTRSGRFLGSVDPALGRDAKLRVAQFTAALDGERAMGLARRVLDAKLANGAEVLRRYRDKGSDGRAEVRGAIDAVELGRTSLPEAEHLAALAGVEGAAARAYFDGVMKFNRSEFSWPGRVRHPATDPINALLSFTYTLLGTELHSLAEGHGLDAYLGFLHQPDHGRASLALDLLEPFRHPVADRLVLTVLNRREFTAVDFEGREGRDGVFLTREALGRFIHQYEAWMLSKGPPDHPRPSFRQLLRKEVEKLVLALRTGGEWDAFHWVEDGAGDGGGECNTSSVTI